MRRSIRPTSSSGKYRARHDTPLREVPVGACRDAPNKLLMVAAHSTALLLLSLMTWRLWRNLLFLHAARRNSDILPAPPLPHVSVLVPARNEAHQIVACIESLAQQAYPNFEVMVLNDQSTDATGALLEELAAQYPNVRVIHSRENPPAGWNGKSYACARLAEHASGDWLLFTDADTCHTPTSIAQGIAQAAGLKVDLLSAFPDQQTETWSEQVVVSFILDFLPLIAVDLHDLWRGRSEVTVANGQYMLVQAEAYRASGGHHAIFDQMVDDLALAKQVRLSGYKIAFVDGTALVRCRMYHNALEVWNGFSKNIMLGLETSSTKKRPVWWGGLFAWAYACIFVLPFYHLLFSDQKRVALLEIGWLGLLRGMVNRYLRRPVHEIPTTPLGAWSVMALGLSALYRRKFSQTVQWKGRDYDLSG